MVLGHVLDVLVFEWVRAGRRQVAKRSPDGDSYLLRYTLRWRMLWLTIALVLLGALIGDLVALYWGVTGPAVDALLLGLLLAEPVMMGLYWKAARTVVGLNENGLTFWNLMMGAHLVPWEDIAKIKYKHSRRAYIVTTDQKKQYEITCYCDGLATLAAYFRDYRPDAVEGKIV